MLSQDVWDVGVHHFTLVIQDDTIAEDWVLSTEMMWMGIGDIKETFVIP